MANRWFNQFSKTMEKEVVNLFAHVTFGAAGAPTLVTADSKGIVSITRSSAGKYVLVFGTKAGMLDTYYKFLAATATFDTITPAAPPASPVMYLSGNAISTINVATLTFTFESLAGAATDPASGEGVYLHFMLKNSNAP